MTLLSEMMEQEGPTLQGQGANDEARYDILARLADAEFTIREVRDWLRAIDATQPSLLAGMSGAQPAGGAGGGGGSGGGGTKSRAGDLHGVVV